MVFLLASGAPAVATWCSSLYLGHLRRQTGIPIVSGTPATAKWYSCLYLGHRQWRNSKQQHAKASKRKRKSKQQQVNASKSKPKQATLRKRKQRSANTLKHTQHIDNLGNTQKNKQGQAQPTNQSKARKHASLSS